MVKFARRLKVLRVSGRTSIAMTVLSTSVYYGGKLFHHFWLKDDDARSKKRNYVCSPNTKKPNAK